MAEDSWWYDDDTGKLSDCERLQMAMKDALEPALGTARIGRAELSDKGWFDGAPFLEFHPRQQSTKLIGNDTAGAEEYPHQDPCGLQIDARVLPQIRTEATRARPGSWAVVDSPEQKAEALPAGLSKESGIPPGYDADLGLSSAMKSSSIVEAWSS